MEKINLKNKKILPFKFKKLKSWKYFLSNDFWQWLILSEREFNDFIDWKTSSELEDRLVSAGMQKSSRLDKNDEMYIKYLAWKWLNRYHYIMQWPSLHIIVLTLACNHSCKYCHASAKIDDSWKYHLSNEKIKKTIDVIFNTTAWAIDIEFQWWEPTANWEGLKYAVEYIHEKNKVYNLKVNINLVSNLTMIDDEKMNFLLDNWVDISTSIDWPKEVHDWNRAWIGDTSSFETVSKWVKKINFEYEKRWLEKKVWAICTVTNKLLDKPQELVDTYISLWLDNIFVRPLNPYGMATKLWDSIGYNYEEYWSFYEKMLDYIENKQEKWINISDTYSHKIHCWNLRSSKRINYMEERSPCGAVLGQVAYNWDWGIYTCDEWRMLAQTWDCSFKIWEIDNRSAEEIYKSMVLDVVTKVMLSASIIDYLPGYDTNPVSNYIWTCPIYSYTISWNINSKYKKEDRFKLQEDTLERLVDQ